MAMQAASVATYRRALGPMAVTAINDGQFEGSFDIVAGLDKATAEHQEKASFRRTPPRLTVNAFLIEAADGALTLVDTGARDLMGPTLGKLAAGLAGLGIAPDAIGTVLLTHLHPDHAAGLIDGAGHAVFPKASIVVAEAEMAFWHDDAIMAAAGDSARGYFDGARAAVAPYADRTRRIGADSDIAPGITAVALPGHTPGHTGYRITSGGETLLIWGDIVHLPGIQFACPQAGMVFDVDADLARTTRARVLDQAASDRFLVAGMHLDFPAFGHVARAAEGYAFVPDVWSAM